jgi:hypothetical protein
MKKTILLLVVLALALPLAAFADNSDEIFTNTQGTLWGTSFGLTLTDGTLTSVTGLGDSGTLSGDLGTVTFATGTLRPGSNVNDGGTFNSGGSILITSNGTDGLDGTLFTGSFSQIGTWSYTTDANGNRIYTMLADVTGTTGTGQSATGTYTVTLNTGTSVFSAKKNPGGASGTLTLAVPEPGEVSLIGTGLLGLIGGIRRKVKRQSAC